MSTGITFAKIIALFVLVAIALGATPVMNLMRRYGIWPMANAQVRVTAPLPGIKPAKTVPRVNSEPPRRQPNKKKKAEAFDVYQVSAGSLLPSLLRTPLASSSSHVDDPVRAILRNTVEQEGLELIPAASILHGKVLDVIPASRWQPRGRLIVAFYFIEHATTRSRAAIATQSLVFDPPEPPGTPKRSIDVHVKAGETLQIVLTQPLIVRLPK